MKIVVDLVPYEVTEVPEPMDIAGTTYKIKNFLGLDGIEALKRSNPFNESSGYIGHTLIDVYEDKLIIRCLVGGFNTFQSVLSIIIDAYPSIGWECLDNSGWRE